MTRFRDIIVSGIGIIILFPLLVMLGIAVRLKLGRPVIFRQMRPGRYGVPFYLYKFRSMSDDRDSNGELKPDAERLTQFGRWLRSTSLDELPTLLNVLRGDMSLIGPRPLLMRYLPLYSIEQSRRHDVRPGITGWAQINGRNAVSWERKFELDVWYVDNRSFWFDCKILIMTIAKVLKRDGISSASDATMEEFLGAKNNT